jgi:UDP-N-acetylmuramate dehydrogenase
MTGAGAAVGHEPSWIAPYLDRARRDAAIGPMTTIRIGGSARWLIEPRDAADAASALKAVSEAGLPWRFLGGGSNVLVGDAPYDGVVFHPLRIDDVEISGSTVTAGAGVSLASLVSKTTDAGLAGLEVVAGIPGQVGGAIAMNAGGRHGEIGPSVAWVRVATPEGAVETLAGADLRFGYRRSEIPPGSMVVAAAFALRTGDRRQLKAKAGAIIKEKNAVQPTTAWNFGCMFKNPPSGSAGRLVDACGLKGLVHGGARISPVHGNFVENLGSASARDVVDLIEIVEDAVRARHGIVLEREVKVWGA